MQLLILLITVLIFLIGIPITISYFIYKWIKNKGLDKRYRLLALIPIIITGYFIYDAFYPDSDFYKEDFKEVTEMEFPEKGEILYKTASYPDLFGDYTSSFLAEFDKTDINNLEANLKSKSFIKKESKMSTKELDYIEKRKGDRKYSAEYIKEIYTGKYYSVGFLNDNKSVIITRVSW
ncbi:hypothetical protein [Flavobacterium hydatis]|jgi:hypothetical protein|uniref:Uncharacterized protein n=1 Tax=Flavobacterium hydatis TaxID=991 RepID=A0A086A061_FLAHY|nr:hypothetical protein [Flavobacterium hydatis]KFF10075.1 hypothetical protein IW20_21630 [Flavobacterium hydatis]OXA93288.1 hypothetical protein B0A62_13660 [Flavobacterium hydatis]